MDVKTLQKPWGRVEIFDLLFQSRPPQRNKKIGGLAFTIVDPTLDDLPIKNCDFP